MKCPKCHLNTPNNSKFCQNCGCNIQDRKLIKIFIIVFIATILALIISIKMFLPQVSVDIGGQYKYNYEDDNLQNTRRELEL